MQTLKDDIRQRIIAIARAEFIAQAYAAPPSAQWLASQVSL